MEWRTEGNANACGNRMKALALLKALAFLKALVAAAVAIVREGPQQLCRVWVVIAEAKTLPGQALETSADRSIPWRQICVETGSGFFKARIIRMVAVHTLKSNLRRRAAADHLAK